MSNPDDMRACIDACLDCYRTCTATAMTYCLEMGGDHTAPGHFRLMMACSEICRTAAHMMLIHFDGHVRICRECAEICTRCADDCDAMPGMESCAAACRACAAACYRMAAVDMRPPA